MSELRAAVLMCHAPIVIPAIAGPRALACEATTRAMRRAVEHVMAQTPETVVLVSPHLPRHATAFGWADGPSLMGDFGSFGHPERSFRVTPNPEAQVALAASARQRGLSLKPTPTDRLDHGSAVPLWFFHEAGCPSRWIVLGLPWESHPQAHRQLGAVLRETFRTLNRSWALVASGDLSHALAPHAPAGYHPRAADFDAALVAGLRQGPLAGLDDVDPDLRQAAAEDVVDVLHVARGALGPEAVCSSVLSYEAPFGVGYAVAILQ